MVDVHRGVERLLKALLVCVTCETFFLEWRGGRILILLKQLRWQFDIFLFLDLNRFSYLHRNFSTLHFDRAIICELSSLSGRWIQMVFGNLSRDFFLCNEGSFS